MICIKSEDLDTKLDRLLQSNQDDDEQDIRLIDEEALP